MAVSTAWMLLSGSTLLLALIMVSLPAAHGRRVTVITAELSSGPHGQWQAPGVRLLRGAVTATAAPRGAVVALQNLHLDTAGYEAHVTLAVLTTAIVGGKDKLSHNAH